MNYKITQELGNQLIAYLSTQPFSQVYQLIQSLQHLEPLDQPEARKAPDG